MNQKRFQQLWIGVLWFAGLLLTGTPSATGQVDSVPDSSTVSIQSSPIGGFIFLDGQDIGMIAPAEIRVSSGEHLFELVLEGYEPLAKRLGLEAGKRTRLEFSLKSLPPSPVTTEQLGLVSAPLIARLDEKRAANLERKWTGLAETFAIVPLGQGLLARIVLPKEHHSAANSMVIAGLGLTAGSYLLGKILGKRKLRQIRARNDEIPSLNDAIRLQNQEINQTVRAANSQAVRIWMAENEGRGVVTITVE